MKLHIFNPEHDIVLATNVGQFTAPHAARELRGDLGFLPALWADEGDAVLVDDVMKATSALRHLRKYAADVLLVSPSDLAASPFLAQCEPQVWGWDNAVVAQLRRTGMSEGLPTDEQLEEIRRLSSRTWAASHLLPALRNAVAGTTGEATVLTSFSEQDFVSLIPFVLKAPWSSSGRGIRYVQTLEQLNRNATWARRVIARQGGIMLEPYYNKVSDFAMEYEVTANGEVVYRGLSLFRTQNGAYTGSIIATEEAKDEMLSRYVTSQQLEAVRQTVADILAPVLRGVYAGPFGIDMMVVAREGVSGFLLHPCIELNLRRTMGHVALSLPCDATMPQRLMRICYSGNYRLQVMNTNENVLDGFLLR